MKRPCLLPVLGALAALTTWSCGGGGHSDGSPDFEPPPAAATALLAAGDLTDFAPVEEGDVARGTVVVPFMSTIPAALNPSVRVQVDWTLAADTLDVGVYPEGCTAERLGEGSCASVAAGRRSGTAPRNITEMAPVTGRTYVLGIRNRGPHRESGAFQVVVSYTAE